MYVYMYRHIYVYIYSMVHTFVLHCDTFNCDKEVQINNIRGYFICKNITRNCNNDIKLSRGARVHGCS